MEREDKGELGVAGQRRWRDSSPLAELGRTAGQRPGDRSRVQRCRV